MHSRSFLHRTHTGPHAAAPHEGSGATFPLGFADVRSDEPPTDAPGRRGPIGFAPPAPLFVTELSFRRTASPGRVQPRAEHTAAGGEPSAGGFGVGHASSWTPASAEREDAADEPRSEVVQDEAPATPEPAPDEPRVPFYKREISLRRRKPTAVVSDDPVEEVPADDEAGVEPEQEQGRTGVPIGFAAPGDQADEAGDRMAASDDHDLAAESDASASGPEAHDDSSDPEPHEDVEPAVEQPSADAAPAVDDDQAAASAERHDGDADEAPEPDEHRDEPVAAAEFDDAAAAEPDVADVAHEDAGDPEAVAAGDPSKKRSSLRARRGGTPGPKPNGSSNGRGGRKVVGLKIGASQVAAAVVTRSDRGHELVELARQPLEPGIVVDGEVRDPDALREALRSFFDEHRLPRKDVRVGVASNRIGVRTVDLSGIEDEARFDNAVRFKAHEVLPVSVSESVLDYRVVEERVTETGEIVRRVLLVVAPRDQVEPFASACTGAGLKLGGIDLEALALLRAFVEPAPLGARLSTDTATVVVAIGHESTTLLVAGGGACEFTRVFDWGGLTLQQAIALELDVHSADAAKILHGLSLSGEARTGLDEERRARALEAVRTRLTPFARELVQSLQFYQGQESSLGIGEIVITGGASHLEGLADALHQMIGVSVRVGDPLQRVHVGHALDPALERTIGSLAVPIGLAIVDEPPRGVNLLPDELRRQKRKRPSALSVALPIAAVVPIAAMGFLFVQANGDAGDQRSSLQAVQAEIDALPEPTRPVIDPSLAVEQQQRAAALASVLGTRLAWDRVLGDLSRVLPDNVWLTSFSARTPDPASTSAALPPATPGVAPTPTGVTIQGYTYSLPDVALLLSRLSTVPSLTNVSLGGSDKREIGKKAAIGFTIIADIDGNGGDQ
jgi:type IV pilus assembly protein PilM